MYRSLQFLLALLLSTLVISVCFYGLEVHHMPRQLHQWFNRSQASPSPINHSAALSGELTTPVGQVPKVQQMTYVMGKPSPCPENQFLVMCVHTAPDHLSRRQVVRSTWGNGTRWNNTLVTVRFMLGRPANDSASGDRQRALVEEQADHGDLVQLDFVDSYRNLTLKGVATMQWLTDYCASTRFVLKVDDDVFVNMFALIPRLHAIAGTDIVIKTASSSSSSSTASRVLLLCLIWRRAPALRVGKWSLGTSDYTLKTLPDYCSGPAYIMTMNFVTAALRLVPSVPLIPVEDVYFTGLIAHALEPGRRPEYIDFGRYFVHRGGVRRFADSKAWRDAIFSHLEQSPERLMARLWQCVEANNEGRTPPPIDDQLIRT